MENDKDRQRREDPSAECVHGTLMSDYECKKCTADIVALTRKHQSGKN
jgi:hypothetical protein